MRRKDAIDESFGAFGRGVGGLDGCPGGWVFARIAGGSVYYEILEKLPPALPRQAAMLAIDMPVGLPAAGDRLCDLAARALLPAAARASVFTGLRRPLLALRTDYAAANAWAKTDGKGLSRQAWGLLAKVAEVDALMTPVRQRRVREAHPELIFRRFAGGAALAPKRTPQGHDQRLALLAGQGLDVADDWFGRFPRSRAKPDDLLDAAALALLAVEMTADGGRRVPADPPRDERGLAMEIWY